MAQVVQHWTLESVARIKSNKTKHFEVLTKVELTNQVWFAIIWIWKSASAPKPRFQWSTVNGFDGLPIIFFLCLPNFVTAWHIFLVEMESSLVGRLLRRGVSKTARHLKIALGLFWINFHGNRWGLTRLLTMMPTGTYLNIFLKLNIISFAPPFLLILLLACILADLPLKMCQLPTYRALNILP